MILVVSTCRERLSEEEFVRPVEEILNGAGVKYFTEHYKSINKKIVERASKVIVCGTALADLKYLHNKEGFSWLKGFNGEYLGICSGMQILATIHGCTLIEKTLIGQFEVVIDRQNELTGRKKFRGYFLHSRAVKPNENFQVIATSQAEASIIKHKSKRQYGIAFHPEVLNPEIIVNFAHL